jgi:hypothetical protein
MRIGRPRPVLEVRRPMAGRFSRGRETENPSGVPPIFVADDGGAGAPERASRDRTRKIERPPAGRALQRGSDSAGAISREWHITWLACLRTTPESWGPDPGSRDGGRGTRSELQGEGSGGEQQGEIEGEFDDRHPRQQGWLRPAPGNDQDHEDRSGAASSRGGQAPATDRDHRFGRHRAVHPAPRTPRHEGEGAGSARHTFVCPAARASATGGRAAPRARAGAGSPGAAPRARAGAGSPGAAPRA